MIAAVLAAFITMLALVCIIYSLALLVKHHHQGQHVQQQIEERMGFYMSWSCLWCRQEIYEPFQWPPLCEACRVLYDVQRCRRGA